MSLWWYPFLMWAAIVFGMALAVFGLLNFWPLLFVGGFIAVFGIVGLEHPYGV